MQKRMHSREFNLEVVRQIASGQKRPAQACREYSLADSVLSRWRKEYQEQRIAELERFCGQLALESQVLKKRCRAWASGSGMP